MLKIMNVKMVVDEEGNEVKALVALYALHKMNEKDYNYLEWTNNSEPILDDLFDMLERAKAVKSRRPQNKLSGHTKSPMYRLYTPKPAPWSPANGITHTFPSCVETS